MNVQNTQALMDIFNNTDIYMLIFIRILGFLMFLPVIGGRSNSAVIKIGLALGISTIIFANGIDEVFYDDNLIGYGMLLLKEFFVGIIVSYIISFFFNIVYLAGHITDQQIGFSMANVFDPVSNAQVPITGNLYYFSLCALFVVNGGHYMVISAIINSYKALPIGKAYLIGNNGLFFGIINMMGDFFKIGMLIALPIVGVILVMDVALGILVRTVPKINVFVIGMPLKVIAGLFALWFIIPIFSNVYAKIYYLIQEAILNSIKVMM